MKIKLGLFAFLLSLAASAQVGIGTTDPQATLHIVALPGDELTHTGLLIPTVDELPLPCEEIPNGLIVFFNGIEQGNIKQGLYIYSIRDCNWKRIIGV